MKMYKKRKTKKKKKLALFQKKGLNFAISKFSKFFKNYCVYKSKAQLEVSIGKKIQKK